MIKLSLLAALILAIFFFNICQGSFWDHKPGHNHGPLQRVGRDRPRPLRHHRHIQGHNGYHRPHPRIQRPIPPPPSHRRRSRPPPHFRHGPPFQNKGSMFLQSMMHNQNHVIPHNRPIDHSPPQRHESPAAQFFQQDEIIQEQSKHFPIAAVANQQLGLSKMPPLVESQPHGYLSSTYKGWKPIVKPYQNSYLGSPNIGASSPKPSFAMTGHPPSKAHGHSPNPNLNLNTLFRENTNHMRTGNPLKSAYSENLGVRVPSPGNGRVNENTEKPNLSNLPDFPWNTRFMTSQSEEAPVVKKPFKVKVPQQSTPPQQQSSTPPIETFDDNSIKFPKFKFRPRPRPGLPFSKDIPHDNPSEINIQKAISQSIVPQSQSEEQQSTTQEQQSLNLKNKLSRGRIRVRKPVKVDQSSQSDEENLPPPKPLQPFENHPRPHSESQQHERQQNTPPPFKPTRGKDPGHRHIVDSVDERSRAPPLPPPPPPAPPSHQTRGRGPPHGQISPPNNRGPPEGFSNQSPPPRRHHGPPNHSRERNSPPRPPPLNFYEHPPFSPDFNENIGPESNTNSNENNQQQQPQRERRKRPKGENQKNSITETEQSQKPQEQSDFPGGPNFLDDIYFPPGFSPDPSKNTGRDPVSFMTMPGSKPQIIHHIYNSHHPQREQQLFHNNVMRSPVTDHDYPHEGHGSSPTGNNIPINRPRFATVNVHNRPVQSHGHNPNLHNQHNSGAIYPSNSNHESAYFPNAFSSNISPYTYGEPYLPPNRNHMSHSPLSPAAQHNVPQSLPPMPSTTMRNMYPPTGSSGPPPPPPPFSPSYDGSSTMNSVEYRDSSETNAYPSATILTPPNSYSPYPPPPSTSPRYYSSPTTASQRPLMQPPAPYPEYVPAPSYSSGEYDKIPMQFMDQLKPILRDEQQSTSATRNTHQSPDIHPPSTFFDDFFQPFDQPGFNQNPEQELDTKSSSPVRNQIRVPTYGTSPQETYNQAQSSPKAQIIPHPSSRYASSTMAYKEVSRTPNPTKTYPAATTMETSATRNSDFSENNSDMYSVAPWSKLKENEVGVSSTESISPDPTPHQKKTNKVNQSKQHHSIVSSSSKPKAEVSKSKSKDAYKTNEKKLEEIAASEIVTTYKPSEAFSGFEKISSGQRDDDKTLNAPKGDTELTLQHEEDDLSDSNTPKSIRLREKEKFDKIATTTEVPEAFVHSTTFKSRRQLRRRRPDGTIRRRFFSSRVKTPFDEEKYHGSSSNNNNVKSVQEKVKESSPIEERDDDGYEPSRISALKHRRLFQRRRNLAATVSQRQQVKPESKEISTTPSQLRASSSTEAESVTYGESQWFRIKPTESGELEQPSASSPSFHSGNKQLTLPNSSTKTINDGGGKEQQRKLLSNSVPEIELLPLESSTSETTSTEVSPQQPKFSSKHSVSFTEGRKFNIRKQPSS